MWPFLPAKPRPPLRLLALVGAGLLGPTFIVAAQAQGELQMAPRAALSAPTIAASAMAPREQREQLAPAVMQAEARQAQATANQLAFEESVKRLSQTEQNSPAEALAQYKRFFAERTLAPELGVQVGLKIAELRLAMGDAKGALQTCQVIGAKYADEPTAALFALEKARVLMGQKQLAGASQSVNEAMPSLVALGPSRYLEISELLLQLVQANLDSGETEDKERAKALCVDVEEIYLRWLKGNTVDHLRERFQVLQANYRAIGEQKRAEELFPKISDALLRSPVDPNNGEAGVMSLQMAQWIYDERSSKSVVMSSDERNEAFQLYTQAAVSSDDFHSGWSIMECFGRELKADPKQAETHLLQIQKEVKTPSARIAIYFLLARARYKDSDWDAFLSRSKEAIEQYESTSSESQRKAFAQEALHCKDAQHWAKMWKSNLVVAEQHDLNITFDKPLQQSVERRIFVNTVVPVQLQVSVEDDAHRVSSHIEKSPWSPELEDIRHQQIVVVSISPGEVNINALIHVKVAGQNSDSLNLPLRISSN